MTEEVESAKIRSPEIFRDSVATISMEGKRNFIYPKKPKGKLYKRRTWFSISYLMVFFTLPFLRVNDEPLLMLNILERKFIIFGLIFWPQDFFIFGIAMITFIVFIILFTVVFGRIFCGWACPQTIFMEMVFRKIEYLIDGDSTHQKLLHQMKWNRIKILKRSTKFVVFYLLSFIIANFFLAYIIGMDNLLNYINHPASNVTTLISLFIFTTVFFIVYWWFREQACIVVCPYGRLQGVLLDKDSIVVAYDYSRGEPRGKFTRAESLKQKNVVVDHCKCVDCKSEGACKDIGQRLEQSIPKGDCIDCRACVKVCPTGIDIRNGTQMECVNCTACIDACDSIMESVHKPKGLIRYASQTSIAERKHLAFTSRVKAYTAVLSLLLCFLAFLVVGRTDLDARLMRTAGMTYTTLPDGRVSNLYNLKLANKTHKNIALTLKLENIKGEIYLINYPVVKKEDYASLQFFVKLKREDLKSWKTPIIIGLYDSNGRIKTITANFIGPEIYN